MTMKLISNNDLVAKLDSGDDFKLVMVLGERAFRNKHLPGSMYISHPSEITELLDPTDEIILYCSAPSSPASKQVYQFMAREGYGDVRRYAGGITDWEENGLPLEGEWAEPQLLN